MRLTLQVTVGQVCSAVCGGFDPLIIEDKFIFVEFNGMLSKVYVKKEYGTE